MFAQVTTGDVLGVKAVLVRVEVGFGNGSLVMHVGVGVSEARFARGWSA